MHLLLASVLVGSCLCLLVSTHKDEINNISEVEVLPLTSNSLTVERVNETLQRGPKKKIKKIIGKVKDVFKQIGGGGGGGGYRFRNKNRYSNTRYDTSTVLWFIFGSMGGGILFMAIYCYFRHRNKP